MNWYQRLQLQIKRQTSPLILKRQLNAVNPLATLDRGYAILKTVPEGALLRSSLAIAIGDKMEARLVDGSLLCRVEEQRPDEPKDRDQAGSEPDLGKT